MIKLRRNFWTVIFLVLLFVMPGVVAYFFYINPNWSLGKETNKGSFIKPPVLLSEFKPNNHWRLVYYSANTCGAICLGNLDKLSRVRLALGRRLYNVDIYLLLTKHGLDITEKQKKLLRDIDINVLKFDANDLHAQSIFKEQDAFYIVSPENYAILTYQVATPPDDIFQDIKKLVKD